MLFWLAKILRFIAALLNRQRWDENDQNVMEASLNKYGKKQQKDPPIGVSGRASADDKESCHHPPIQDMTKISRPKHSCQRHSHKGTTSTNCSSTHSTADCRCTTDSCRCSDLTAGQCHCHCNSSEVAPHPTSLPQCKVLSESIPPPSCSLESKAINRKNINKHSKCKISPPSSSSSHLENIARSEIEYSACKEGCLISARKEIPQIVLQRESSCGDSSDSSNVVDVLYGANVELFKNAKVLSDHRFRGKDDSFVSPSLKVDTCTDFALHPLLSPRSSNGSICSVRSSNADSAVDILTPDEELYSVGDVQIPADSVDWFTSSSDSPERDTTISLAEAVLPIPAVVISDHSEPLEDAAEDSYCLDSGTECRLTLRRNASNSSLCSNDSSLSSSPALSRTESNVSLTETDEEIPVETKPKQSSWKKIRNIVHWSPFIQQFKKNRYPWIQLAGHQGNFQAGEPGAVLKKYDSREQKAFDKLMKDVLRSYVPEYRGDVLKNNEKYLQLQDLLCEFDSPCVMDIKMGTRTYLEEELEKAREKPKLRKDMYQKMIEVDPSAPTEEENAQGAIIKPRYMQWRDEMSSSTHLGFRIEGIKKMDGASSKNFKKTKTPEEVKEALKHFVGTDPEVYSRYIKRLKAIRVTQESSEFFSAHEIIGSSLLFVHDKSKQASVWMIDFGKTNPLPDHVKVNHRNLWVEGNHEDGYLFGLDNLISILETIEQELLSVAERENSNIPCE